MLQSMGCKESDMLSNLTGPFPSPGGLLNLEIKPRSPTLQVGSLPSEPPGKPDQLKFSIFLVFWIIRNIMAEALCFIVQHVCVCVCVCVFHFTCD